jgi:hypothetical protein
MAFKDTLWLLAIGIVMNLVALVWIVRVRPGESVRWLITKGRWREAKEEVGRRSKVNGWSKEERERIEKAIEEV